MYASRLERGITELLLEIESVEMNIVNQDAYYSLIKTHIIRSNQSSTTK